MAPPVTGAPPVVETYQESDNFAQAENKYQSNGPPRPCEALRCGSSGDKFLPDASHHQRSQVGGCGMITQHSLRQRWKCVGSTATEYTSSESAREEKKQRDWIGSVIVQGASGVDQRASQPTRGRNTLVDPECHRLGPHNHNAHLRAKCLEVE